MGHTYGENSVMQMYVPGRDKPAYGAELHWEEALDAPAASQMRHLKRLMLSRPYFERVPDQSLILANGVRYARVLATRGKSEEPPGGKEGCRTVQLRWSTHH